MNKNVKKKKRKKRKVAKERKFFSFSHKKGAQFRYTHTPPFAGPPKTKKKEAAAE